LWSQGLLYDNLKEINTNVTSGNHVLGLYNRGDFGSGHGWASVHSVAWNCNVGTSNIIIQKPPTAQNYGIGCIGNVTGVKPPAPFSHPQGYIEGTNVSGLNPQSLYLAQLSERLIPVNVKEEDHVNQPKGFYLEQNYPNPFNPSTVIKYNLAKNSFITLRVYDFLGKELAILVNEFQQAGFHSVNFSMEQLNNKVLASGVYFYRLNAGDFSSTKKMILIR
jgi:hypothetical protein